MTAMDYKTFHESFMQNNHGSTVLHTFACIFFTVQCAIYIAIKSRFSICCQYTYEYFVIVLPMIIAHTVTPQYIYTLNLIVFIILLFNLLFYHRNIDKKFSQKNEFQNNRVPWISCLRGLTYLITALCILAVDFQDFPRNLAKTERYGYSLMDTGVGLFVIVSGLVYKDIRKEKLINILKSNVKIISLLLILGVGRFISVSQLDYQQHVTEYGVHWNFFFTIAVCKVISTVILYFSDRALLLSFSLLLFHEFTLYFCLQDWVFSDSPRTTLLSANREGITSCLGYVSAYLFGVHLKNILLNTKVTKFETQTQLLFESVVMWTLTYLVDIVRPTSRTLANAGFCIYMNTIVVTVTGIVYFIIVLVEEKDKRFRVPIILSCINTNGLSYFLIANLLTGAVNLSIRTLLVSSTVTFIILNAYMVLTIVIIVYLKILGLKI